MTLYVFSSDLPSSLSLVSRFGTGLDWTHTDAAGGGSRAHRRGEGNVLACAALLTFPKFSFFPFPPSFFS